MSSHLQYNNNDIPLADATLKANTAPISCPTPELEFEASFEHDPLRKPIVTHKQHPYVEIKSNRHTHTEIEQTPPCVFSYPTHIPNNTPDYPSLMPVATFLEYDLDLNITSERYKAVGVLHPPKTVYGTETKVVSGDKVIFNGNTQNVWEIGAVNLYSPEICYVTYVACNQRTRKYLLIHIPRIWSMEANHRGREMAKEVMST